MRKMNIMALLIVALLIASNVGLAQTTVDNLDKEVAVSMTLVNQDPDPAIAGEMMVIQLGISNLGGAQLNNLVTEIEPNYPFQISPGDNKTQQVGALGAYQGSYGQSIQIVKYRLLVDRNAVAGTYNLKVLNYMSGSNVKTETSFPIDIKGQQSAEIIQIDKTVLIPGQQTPLKFTITNVGNSPLEDLSFSWDETNNVILPVGSDNTQYIKYIDVGKSANLEYQVISDTNANPGLYKLNLHLAYNSPINNTHQTISTTAGVYVGGGTDFDVAYSQTSGTQTSFSVANIGSNPAYSVSVVVPNQPNWRVSGSNSNIIGNLNKGDYTVASFSLQSAVQNRTATGGTGSAAARGAGQGFQPQFQRDTNSTASPGTVEIQIIYTDTMGNRNTVTKNVNVGLQNLAASGTTAGTAAGAGFSRRNQQTSPLTYILYALIVVVLVGGVFAYREYRRQKVLDPRFKLMDLLKSLQKGKKK